MSYDLSLYFSDEPSPKDIYQEILNSFSHLEGLNIVKYKENENETSWELKYKDAGLFLDIFRYNPAQVASHLEKEIYNGYFWEASLATSAGRPPFLFGLQLIIPAQAFAYTDKQLLYDHQSDRFFSDLETYMLFVNRKLDKLAKKDLCKNKVCRFIDNTNDLTF